jgi:hypothetical protein
MRQDNNQLGGNFVVLGLEKVDGPGDNLAKKRSGAPGYDDDVSRGEVPRLEEPATRMDEAARRRGQVLGH